MQLASYSVPSSSRLAPTQTVPEAHTFDDKVDLLFREFDRNTDHVLDLDELRNAFGLFSNVFSPATIADLVAKIDYKRTSAVSRSDWEKFCQRYPTLVDAFYCRVRAFLEMSSRQAGIDEAQLRLQQLRDAEARARQAVEDGRRAHQGAEERLAAAEEALRRAIEEQRELERAVMQSRRDVDQQQLECTRYASELDSQRQKEAHAARVHADCAQHLAHVTQLHSTANAQLVKFADQEQHNAAMSIQIKTDIERFRSEVSQLRITIHELKQREQATGHGLAETLRDVVVSGERMNAIDLEVAALQAREHDLRDALNRAMDATTTAAALKDEEHMAFRALKDAESGSAIELSAAQASADEVAQRLRHLESENEAFQHKRVEVEQQEVPLIHQEIRLRHQRHFLEEEEMLLRGNHTLFVEAASSVDVGQRPSRLVSPDLKEAAPLPPSPRAVPEPLHAYHDRPDVALAPLPAGHYTAAPTAHPYHVETTSWAASHAHAASFSSTTRQTESAIAAYTSAGARGARY